MINRNELLFGPYLAPRVQRGGFLTCEKLGRAVCVAGFSDAPIVWPCRWVSARSKSLILCGDLIRAVRLESEVAVCLHWGVSESTVLMWRRALSVGRSTVGSKRLRSAVNSEVKLGTTHGDQARSAVSRAHKGKRQSPEQIRKRVEARKATMAARQEAETLTPEGD